MDDPRLSSLKDLVAQNDHRAVDVARQVGPPAVTTLEPFITSNGNSAALAVQAVIEAGGPRAPVVLLRACELSDEQARYEAARGLSQRLPTGIENDVLALWLKTNDPYLRHFLTLALGRTSNATRHQLKEWLDESTPATDQNVTDALTAALIKQGETSANPAYLALFQAARANRAAQVIDLSRYVDKPAYAKALRPLLDRREDAVDLSNHVMERTRRVCDIAIDEFHRLQPAALKFKVDGYSKYGDEQIAEAIRACDALPAIPSK